MNRLGLAFIGLISLCSPAGAVDKIRIAISNPNMPNLTVAIAQRKGFFKQENIDAEIIRMNPNASGRICEESKISSEARMSLVDRLKVMGTQKVKQEV